MKSNKTVEGNLSAKKLHLGKNVCSKKDKEDSEPKHSEIQMNGLEKNKILEWPSESPRPKSNYKSMVGFENCCPQCSQ